MFDRDTSIDADYVFDDLAYESPVGARHEADLLEDDPMNATTLPYVDPKDPLVQLARRHGVEVLAGEPCHECGEPVGATVVEGAPVVACLGALVPEEWQTCSWHRMGLPVSPLAAPAPPVPTPCSPAKTRDASVYYATGEDLVKFFARRGPNEPI